MGEFEDKLKSIVNKPMETPESYPRLVWQDTLLFILGLFSSTIFITATTAIMAVVILLQAEYLFPVFTLGYFSAILAYTSTGIKGIRQEHNEDPQSAPPFEFVAVLLILVVFNCTLIAISMGTALAFGQIGLGTAAFVGALVAPSVDTYVMRQTGYSIAGVAIRAVAYLLVATGALSSFSLAQIPILNLDNQPVA